MSGQGWTIDNVGHTITFFQAPAAGAPIVVQEYAQSSVNATYIWALGAWGPHTGYPVEVEFFSNRLFFAGTTQTPSTLWSTKISQWNNFGKSVPTEDDDAITATLVAKQVNAITDLLPLKDLVTMTTGSEWRTTGGTSNVLTPSTVSFVPQSNYGSGTVPALIVGNSAVFLQARGDYVRDLGYQFAVDQYAGENLCVFASHLVQDHTIVDWAYQQTPFSVIWAVRDDGVLLGLAYFKEQQVMGWFHCDSVNGFYESVCSVTEGDEDALYVSVRRVVNGQTVRYVERLDTRFQADQRDYFFVDAGLSYDGRNSTTAPTATMTLTGGNTLTCTGYAPFASTNVGDWVKLYVYTPAVDAQGNTITDEFGVPQQVQSTLVCQITAYTSPTVVTVTTAGSVPTPPGTGIATASWDFCPLTFSGLTHLIGQTVSILADGNVTAPQVVSAQGTVTLQSPAAVVHIGLPITADFETLEVNVIGGQEVRDRRKIINKIALIVTDSRGAQIGPDPDNLLPMKGRFVSDGYWNSNALVGPSQGTGANQGKWTQNPLLGGVMEAYPQTTFQTQGRVFVRQTDPLPLTILGVIPDVAIGGG